MGGHPQLVILWGSSCGEYPWCIADWVEEIHSSSAYLALLFQHVVLESNIVDGNLAKAGASRTISI